MPAYAASVVAVLGLFAASAAGDDTVLLKPVHQPGPACYIEFKEELQSTVSGPAVPGGAARSKARRIVGVFQSVVPVPSAKASRLRFTWDRMMLSVENSKQSVAFDSDLPDETHDAQGMGGFFRAMLGESLTLDIDAAGRTAGVGGLEQVRERVKAATHDSQAYQQLGSVLDDETNEQMWASMRYVLYPNRQVKLGETWSASARLKGRGVRLAYDYTCKLERFDTQQGRRLAVVTYEGAVTRAPAASQPQGPQISGLAGKFTGSALFDIERGAFTRQSQTVTLSADSTIPKLPGPGSKLHNEQTILQTYTLMSEQERQAQKPTPAAASQTAAPASRASSRP